MAQQQPYNPYYGSQPPYQTNPPPPGFAQPPQQQAPPYIPPPIPPGAGYTYAGGNVEDTEAGHVKSTNLQFNNATVRAAFVRKVFMLLTIMLSVVAALIGLFIFVDDLRLFVRRNPGFYYVSYVTFLVTYITIICCESVRRNFPGNLICLSVLTLSMGYMTAMIASFHNQNTVFIAAFICVICCASIMLFACQTKYDFTSCIGVMFVISMVMFVFGIVAIISITVFKVKFLYMIYAGLASLVFMVYLAIDTQMVIGGKRHEYSPEDYIVAAIQLFLDIIYIFIYLLQIIGYINK